MEKCMNNASHMFDNTPPSITARHYSRTAADPEVWPG